VRCRSAHGGIQLRVGPTTFSLFILFSWSPGIGVDSKLPVFFYFLPISVFRLEKNCVDLCWRLNSINFKRISLQRFPWRRVGGNSFGQGGIGGTRTTVHFMDRGQLSFRAHQPFMDWIGDRLQCRPAHRTTHRDTYSYMDNDFSGNL
jgi:hypothetical protein